MKTTARFHIDREKSLKTLFTVENLSKIWRSIVKGQLRNLDVNDLHDYYDFSVNIEDRTKEIKRQIIGGQYKASTPFIYRQEKTCGICRHIMIPTPSDALVFQTITEHIAPQVEKAQPTKKAYYSRDKHAIKLPHQFEKSGYPWFILWPKYQKEILKFTNSCPFLVVTDITNFFDNIGLRELRHIISARIKAKEIILDLLFNIIEQLAWVPDYLPTSLKGLPTINIEAFRLLPHMMLFEIDEVINKESKGNFVRWMDDINIGAKSKDHAFSILGDVNEVLKSRGLALNLSKTQVYSSKAAKQHFLFRENKYLDQVAKADPSKPNYIKTKKKFISKFESHLKNSNLKNWGKVTKRYFTTAQRLNIPDLRKYSCEIFSNYPEVRPNILQYLNALGFSKLTGRIILRLIKDIARYDDVTLFEYCKLITTLEIPRSKYGIYFVTEISKTLRNPKSGFELYCYIWFLAKYGDPYILINTIQKYREKWKNEHFLARQVVSVLPRLLKFNEPIILKLISEQMNTGPTDAASVATNIMSLFTADRVSVHRNYLFPPKAQKPYPLSKYLILTCLLCSHSLPSAEKQKLIDKTKSIIKDDWYIFWLNKYKLI